MATTKNGIYHPDDYNKKADVIDDMKKMADSIDKVFDQKNSEQEKVNEEIDQDISTIKTEQIEQNSELEALRSALPSETQEGENINIKGTIPVKFKEFKLSGNSKQEIREGYNLLNYNSIESTTINGVTFTINENKSITVNGTATANATFNLIGGPGVYPLELEEGDYTLNGCEGGSSSTYSMEIYDGTTYRACQNGKTTFNTTGTSIRFYISVKSGVTVNNVTFYPMLVKGTEEKEYEPYGSMPSPEFPSPIKTVENSVNIIKCNKNIMKVNTEYYELTENGIKATINSVGKRIAEFTIKKGQIVKFGFKLLSKPTTSSTFTVYVNDIETTNLSFTRFQDFNIGEIYDRTYIATEDVKIKIILWGNSNNDIFEFQLWAELDELTDYIEHQEENYTLLVQQEMLEGDYFIKEADSWKEVHIWNKKELTGNENIKLDGIYNGISQFSIRDITNAIWSNNTYTINAYSNYFKAVAFQNSWEQDETVTTSGGNCARFMTSKCTTVEEFKKFSQEKYNMGNSVVVYYKVIEPIKLNCIDEQIKILEQLANMKAYEEETNIYSTNEVSPVFTVTAVKDINSVITQLNQLILEGGK